MENKYIIELEELTVSTADGQMQLYKIKGFNTPTFDSAGVSKLTPYTEPDAEAIRSEAYDRGLNDGWTNVHNECETAYQKGVNDMYGAIRKICLNTEDGALSIGTLSSIFGKASTYAMIRDYQPMEIISKLREYEEREKEKRMNSRIIKLLDAIDAVYRVADRNKGNQWEENPHVDAVVDELEGLPPASRWIPTSERRPGHGERVLTRTKCGNIEIQTFVDKDSIIRWEDCTGGCSALHTVEAWMPLPET